MPEYLMAPQTAEASKAFILRILSLTFVVTLSHSFIVLNLAMFCVYGMFVAFWNWFQMKSLLDYYSYSILKRTGGNVSMKEADMS